MIIFEDNNYQTINTNPDDNWLEGIENYDGPKVKAVIPESTKPDLVAKVQEYVPDFELVFDEDGTTVKDVIKVPHVYSEREIEAYRESKMYKTKSNLSEYISSNPHIFSGDGKPYTITEDKQFQLEAIINSYEKAVNIANTQFTNATNGVAEDSDEYAAAKAAYDTAMENASAILTWNSTGEACVAWTYENLITLYFEILATVKKLVQKQQELEIEVRDAEATLDALVNINISFYEDTPDYYDIYGILNKTEE
jgi:hypothetical protein